MADQERDRAKALAAVQAMFERYQLLAAKRPRNHIDYDHNVMENLNLIDAGLDGSVSFELFIGPNFSNLNNVMHGGAAGVIFDMATTAALCPVAKPGYWEFMGGVTRSLSISYLKAVPLGITVRLDSKVVSVGRQMAMIQGTMSSLDGSVVYCTAEHHKVNSPVLAHHREAKVKWDEEFEKEWREKGGEVKAKAKI